MKDLVFHVKVFKFCPIKNFMERCDSMRLLFYKHNSVSIFYKYDSGRGWRRFRETEDGVHLKD